MKDGYIAIVDYGVGNLGSVQKMIKKIGYESVITSNVDIINKSSKLILPGVGSYDNAVLKLKKLGIFDVIKRNVVFEKKPILGICLGMQLLGNSSHEGSENGFGFLDFDCLDFDELIKDNTKMIVPNMGWRDTFILKDINFTKSFEKETRFYFVHSYYVPINRDYTVLFSRYNIEFTAALKFENIYGTQFHPEKSHDYGMKILKNYIEDDL